MHLIITQVRLWGSGLLCKILWNMGHEYRISGFLSIRVTMKMFSVDTLTSESIHIPVTVGNEGQVIKEQPQSCWTMAIHNMGFSPQWSIKHCFLLEPDTEALIITRQYYTVTVQWWSGDQMPDTWCLVLVIRGCLRQNGACLSCTAWPLDDHQPSRWSWLRTWFCPLLTQPLMYRTSQLGWSRARSVYNMEKAIWSSDTWQHLC